MLEPCDEFLPALLVTEDPWLPLSGDSWYFITSCPPPGKKERPAGWGMGTRVMKAGSSADFVRLLRTHFGPHIWLTIFADPYQELLTPKGSVASLPGQSRGP